MIKFDISTTMNTKVADAILDRIQQHIATDPAVQVGYFGTSKHRDTLGKANVSVAEVAYRNEYGYDKGRGMYVPARPYIRYTLAQGGFAPSKAGVRKYAVDLFRLSKNQQNKLPNLGRSLVAGMRKTIDSNPFRENSEFIAKRKGFNHPLKGKTGALRDEITFRVVKRDLS